MFRDSSVSLCPSCMIENQMGKGEVSSVLCQASVLSLVCCLVGDMSPPHPHTVVAYLLRDTHIRQRVCGYRMAVSMHLACTWEYFFLFGEHIKNASKTSLVCLRSVVGHFVSLSVTELNRDIQGYIILFWEGPDVFVAFIFVKLLSRIRFCLLI